MAQARGNAVLLVGATVFVGYLFLTRRLQKVVQVLAEPAPGTQQASATNGGQGAPVPAGIKIPTSGGPVVPGQTPGYGVDPYTNNPANYPPNYGRYRQ